MECAAQGGEGVTEGVGVVLRDRAVLVIDGWLD